MKLENLPTISKLNEQIEGMKNFLTINKVLRKVGTGSKNIADLNDDFEKLIKARDELLEYSNKFNDYFGKEGWIMYDSMDHKIIRSAVKEYKKSGINKAQDILINYYNFEQIESKLYIFKQIHEFQIRFKFIEYALDDYKNERYYSMVPLLLMIIDGVVQDIAGKGFHTKDIDLNVWDSITSIDGGIEEIREIFMKGRKIVRTETINMPFRNGILHGMDLGYDNLVVAAKTWSFLFVIRDWVKSKESENIRKDNFEKDNQTPSFKELFKEISDSQKHS